MRLSRYLKPLDFIHFGIYVVLLVLSIIGENVVFSVLISMTVAHYFPLIYLLRKHGYLKSSDDFGYFSTPKGNSFINAIIFMPLDDFLRLMKADRIVVNLVRVLLSALVLLSTALLYRSLR